MTKQQWIAEQIANYPELTAFELCSELNKKSLVSNPIPQDQIAYPATVEELSVLLDGATRFAAQNTQTWKFILDDIKSGETRWFLPNLENLLGGGIINQVQHDAILNLLGTTANRTIPNPNYQTEVYLSPVELAGYDFIYTHEIQEVMSL